jgi:putative ABC transport system substrate-binding protein
MKVVSRQWSVVSVLIATLLGLGSAEAQQAKVHRIGFLSGGFPGPEHWTTKLRQELHDIGYVEGKNLLVESRFSENNVNRLPSLANELVRLNVHVIVAGGRNDTLAAKNATSSTPIVGLSLLDPILDGLVASLARPAANVTGVTTFAEVLVGKRLELLKETVANLTRVAVMWNPHFPEAARLWNQSERAARDMGLQVHSMELATADKFEAAFKEAIMARSGALAMTTGVFINTHEQRIAQLAAKYRLPTIYDRERFVANGGLMSYGPDESERYKRVAILVDRILKGAKPSDLPVEQPTKFELVINLKAAKQIGLSIPPNVLARADRVIK